MPMLGFAVPTPTTRREETCFDTGGNPLGFAARQSQKQFLH